MIYTAGALLAKLNNLTLVGEEDGELIFVGTKKQWLKAGWEEDMRLAGDYEEVGCGYDQVIND